MTKDIDTEQKGEKPIEKETKICGYNGKFVLDLSLYRYLYTYKSLHKTPQTPTTKHK